MKKTGSKKSRDTVPLRLKLSALEGSAASTQQSQETIRVEITTANKVNLKIMGFLKKYQTILSRYSNKNKPE